MHFTVCFQRLLSLKNLQIYMSCSKLSTQDVICFYTSVPPKVVLPAPVLTALPGFKLRCKATGSPLISIALLRNNTVLVNTTNSEAVITLDQQGNYSCVATSRHGTDKKEFPVIFTCKYGWEYVHFPQITSMPPRLFVPSSKQSLFACKVSSSACLFMPCVTLSDKRAFTRQ